MISEKLRALAETLGKYEHKGVSLDAEDLGNVLRVVRQAAEDVRELELRAVPEASRLPSPERTAILDLNKEKVADFVLIKLRTHGPRRQPHADPGPGSAA